MSARLPSRAASGSEHARRDAGERQARSTDTAGAIDLLGDRWVLHVIRAVSAGHHRFGDVQRFTGAATNVLTARLNRLVENGLLVRRERLHEGRARFEYALAAPGLEAMVILDAFESWAARQSETAADSSAEPAS